MIIQNRRREMGKKKEPNYVQDGLIFHLDGINIGNNEGYWTDLVGGRIFNIPSGVTHNGDGFVFASGHGDMVADDYVDWNYATCHLEVCVSGVTKKGGTLLLYDDRKNVGLALGNLDTYLVYGHTNQSDRNAFNFDNTPSTISVSIIGAWQNGEVCTKPASYSYWYGGGKGISLGSSGTGGRIYTGTVYSVRVYNRHLTEAEVLANYNVDVNRFNII